MIASFETSGACCSVALHDMDGKMLSLAECHQERSHARLITVLLEQQLRNLDANVKDLQAIAVSAGPGSYTGLRIGTGAAKGLALALDIPLVSVSSLLALAKQAEDLVTTIGNCEGVIIPILDARRDEAYFAAYYLDFEEIMPEQETIINQAWADNLKYSNHTIFIGDGVKKASKYLFLECYTIDLYNHYPSASTIGIIAADKLKRGEIENIYTFEPKYIKNVYTTAAKPKLPPNDL